MDFTDYGALNALKWLTNQTPAGPPSALWMKLHLGDPGPDATDNPAVETRRIAFIAGSATNDGTTGEAYVQNAAALRWVTMAASESISHVSFWDDETAGNPWFKGALAGVIAVLANNDLDFAIGDGEIRLN